jgi:hypothetical protein
MISSHFVSKNPIFWNGGARQAILVVTIFLLS